MSTKKKILIPWSGGADSTALISMAIDFGHTAVCASFTCGQPHTQIKAEEEARQRLFPLLEELKRDGAMLYYAYSYLEVDTCRTKSPAKQLPAWFFHLACMMEVDDDKRIYDEIHLGYVLNDDAAYTVTHLSMAWNHLCRAMYGIDIDPPKLKFPLLQYRKGTVLQYLQKKGLLEHVHFCELPQLYDDGWRPCDQCPSCDRHNGAIANLQMHNKARYLGDLLVDYDHTSEALARKEADRLSSQGKSNETTEQTPQHDDDVSELVDVTG